MTEKPKAEGAPPPRPLPDRRTVLKTGAALSAFVGGASVPSLAMAQTAAGLPLTVPEWMKEQGRPILSPPYGVPSPFEKDVVRRQRETRVTDTAATSFSPLQNSFGIITPNGLCFERHHAGVPNIDPDRHRLLVHGLVERPLVFTMDDLMRFPSVSRIAFLECSGNTLNPGADASIGSRSRPTAGRPGMRPSCSSRFSPRRSCVFVRLGAGKARPLCCKAAPSTRPAMFSRAMASSSTCAA
jgi:hypothetical protein